MGYHDTRVFAGQVLQESSQDTSRAELQPKTMVSVKNTLVVLVIAVLAMADAAYGMPTSAHSRTCFLLLTVNNTYLLTSLNAQKKAEAFEIYRF